MLLRPWPDWLCAIMLWPTRSVAQNISDALRAQGFDKSKIDSRVFECLEEVGLSALAQRKPDSLSGGEARRLAFARALASKPKLLLLDEPFASLDPVSRDDGLCWLDKVLHSSQSAVILVTHEPSEAISLGGEVRILKDQKLSKARAVEQVCGDSETFKLAL